MNNLSQKIKSLVKRFFHWLQMPVPRWRPAVAVILFFAIISSLLVYGGKAGYAKTYTFAQTDWSGGVSASTLAHPTNQTGWDKYSAQSAADTTGTPGSLKSSGTSINFTENFSGTTYRDAAATTANWKGYAYSRSITIDKTKVPSTQTDFPVLISGTFDGTNGTPDLRTAPTGKVQNASGYDVGFYTNSGCSAANKMAWETEIYTAATGVVSYWVKVASLAGVADPANTVFYMCYGSANITTDQSSATSVWDSNYKGVWHLPNGTTLTSPSPDSTSNLNNGTITSATATTGQIDGSANFNGTSAYIQASDSTSLRVGSPNFTFSFWAKPGTVSGCGANLSPVCIIFNKENSYEVAISNSNNIHYAVRNTSPGWAWVNTALTAPSGVWTYITITYDGVNFKGYKTGVTFSTSGSGNIDNTTYTNALRIGARGAPGAANSYFPGALDEVRISNNTRSADWFTAEFNNQNSPSTFYTVGAEATGGGSLYGQYSRTITIDRTKVPSTQTDFPVLVSGTYSYLANVASGGKVQNANGYDIGFYTNSNCSTGKMAWETESYNPTTGVVNYWVKVASVSSSADTVFYMCYGNPTITTDQSSATSVWDSNYKSVWHMGDGTTTSLTDSTINANTGTGHGSPTPVAITGQIRGGVDFSGSTTFAAMANSIATSGVDYTLSTWFSYPLNTGASGWNTLFRGTTADHHIIVQRSNMHLGVYNNGGGTFVSSSFVMSTLASGWHHLAARTSGSTTLMYIDGAYVGTSAFKSSATINNMGNYQGGTQQWGKADEIRISTGISRSADWITAEYNNQNSPSTFYTVGSESGPSVTGQSIKVNTGTDTVGSVTLTKTDTPGSGTVTYSVSNDGGTNFFTVTPGTLYTFAANGNGDLRWKAVLTGGASVLSITLASNGYVTTATLTSNAYDSGEVENVIGKLAWTASGETATELVKVQVRTSPDGSTWSGWCGLADTTACDGTNYFLTANLVNGSVNIPTGSLLRNGSNDRWFQYRVTLVSGAVATATLADLTVTYVVNLAPEFNTTGAVTVSQVSDSTDANYGKVKIDYSIRDPDTSTGTTNPGFVTPSFQYNIGGSWTAITTGNLSANALANKAVAASNYTSYTAYWSAPTDIPTNYLITAQVRVTLNDNEGANNTATSTSSNFILDTKVPVITTFLINKTANTLNLSITDDTALQYRLSNNADLTADGVNATSGTWQLAGGTTFTNTALAWTFAATPVNPTVYLQVRDSVGNLSSQTAVAPKITAKIQIQDISNPLTLDYKEFVSWDLYVAVTGATFGSYKVYRSTDGTSFSLVSTITSATSNYYIDTSVTNGTTYYYRINATDTDTDIGDYTTVVSDLADGQGGSDSIAPTITAVTVTEQQSTYATITWTTDELSNSKVGYSISPNASFNSEITVASFVTAHSVTVTDLTPNTTYLFQVKSTDVLGNIGTNNNSGAGYTITTVNGPSISNITETQVTGNSATIAWNTDKNSDSYVSYSVSSSLLNPTRVGSATLVGGPPYRHIVNLPGLTAGTKYYYFVESTDILANYSKDTNSGNYYSFVTTSDAQPPVISGVSAPIVVPTSAVIVWTTDEPATTQLSYGLISGAYPTTTTLDSTLTTYHVVYIKGLREVTKYYYRVKSADNAGNLATSSEADFTTSENRILVVHVFGSGAKTTTVTTVLDTTAPIITNIATSDIGSFQATVSFETNEDAIGLVRYHPAKDTTKAHTAADYTYGKTHTIVLTGLILGTEYEFEVKATDKFGNLGTSDRQKFTSLFFSDSRKNITIKDAAAFQQEVDEAIQSALPSLAPPFIEQPQILDITDANATVKWRTNIKAYSVVAYAAEEEYDQSKEDPYTVEVLDTTAKSLDHEINLANLKPNTRYHVQVKSFTLPEVAGKSDDLTFVTKALKVQANIASVTNRSFRAVWTTSDPTTSVVEYRNLKSGEVNQKSSETKELTHDLLVDNLTPGTPYEVRIFGYNDKGNKIETASAVRITTSVDTANPQITALRIDSALIPGTTNKTQTIISWKTDEPANSTVYFKEGSSTPGEKLVNKVELTNSYVTDHAMVLSTLKSGGLYSIQVASTDQAGNQTLFPIRTIVVPRQSESIVDVIFKNFEETFKFLKR